MKLSDADDLKCNQHVRQKVLPWFSGIEVLDIYT